MTSFIQLASVLREQMQANLSRSDILKPLAWITGILLTALCTLAIAKVANWLLVADVCALGIIILLYAVAYTFCLFADRDALRSERYSLHKMAIEHGLLGDSVSGTFEADASNPKLIGPSSSDTKGED